LFLVNLILLLLTDFRWRLCSFRRQRYNWYYHQKAFG